MKQIPLVVKPDQVKRMEAAAVRGYPNEVCGILIGIVERARARVEHVTEARNLNVDRATHRFELDPEEFLKADRWAAKKGLEVIGFWHTHPDHPPKPSNTDREHAWPGYSYLIASVKAGGSVEMRSWRLTEGDFIEEKIEL